MSALKKGVTFAQYFLSCMKGSLIIKFIWKERQFNKETAKLCHLSQDMELFDCVQWE